MTFGFFMLRNGLPGLSPSPLPISQSHCLRVDAASLRPVVDDHAEDVAERFVERTRFVAIDEVRRRLGDAVRQLMADDVEIAGEAPSLGGAVDHLTVPHLLVPPDGIAPLRRSFVLRRRAVDDVDHLHALVVDPAPHQHAVIEVEYEARVDVRRDRRRVRRREVELWRAHRDSRGYRRLSMLPPRRSCVRMKRVGS